MRIGVYFTVVLLAGTAATSVLNADDSRTEGREFFRAEVLPRLAENGCPACHVPHFVRPRVMEYEELLPYLAMGANPAETAIIRKIANLRAIAPDRPTHVGGKRCEALDAEPCRTIIEWWEIEFGSRSATRRSKP